MFSIMSGNIENNVERPSGSSNSTKDLEEENYPSLCQVLPAKATEGQRRRLVLLMEAVSPPPTHKNRFSPPAFLLSIHLKNNINL